MNHTSLLRSRMVKSIYSKDSKYLLRMISKAVPRLKD